MKNKLEDILKRSSATELVIRAGFDPFKFMETTYIGIVSKLDKRGISDIYDDIDAELTSMYDFDMKTVDCSEYTEYNYPFLEMVPERDKNNMYLSEAVVIWREGKWLDGWV